MTVNDWFLKTVREMIKNKYTLTKLPTIKIYREKDGLTTFNFSVSISKRIFEDLLSDDEKNMLWLEGDEQ